MSFEKPQFEEQESSEIDRVEEDLKRALILSGDGNVQTWLDKYEDFYADAFHQVARENPNLVNEWNDLGRREAIISGVKEILDNTYEENDRLPEAA
jgi:hypothetical protein